MELCDVFLRLPQYQMPVKEIPGIVIYVYIELHVLDRGSWCPRKLLFWNPWQLTRFIGFKNWCWCRKIIVYYNSLWYIVFYAIYCPLPYTIDIVPFGSNWILTLIFFLIIQIPTLIARFMGPKWGPSRADKAQVGPMLAPWTLLSG